MSDQKELTLTNWERAVCFSIAGSQGGTVMDFFRWQPILNALNADPPWEVGEEETLTLAPPLFDGETTLSLPVGQYVKLKKALKTWPRWNSGGDQGGSRHRTVALLGKFGIKPE